MKRLLVSLAFCLAAPLFVQPTEATIVTIEPIADAFVTAGSDADGAGSPDLNYGSAGALQVSAPGSSQGEMQSLMEFDFSDVKTTLDAMYGAGGWKVDSVQLQLATNLGSQGTQPNNSIFNAINAGLFKIDWQANDNWGEGQGTPKGPASPLNPPVDGVTYNSLASLESATDRNLGIFNWNAAGNTPVTYTLGLDPSFLADADAGNEVSFRFYAGDTGVSYLFNSRDFVSSSDRPVLSITASVANAPEPGVSALLAPLAFFFVNRRWRRERAK
jgi:hypothetical protein